MCIEIKMQVRFGLSYLERWLRSAWRPLFNLMTRTVEVARFLHPFRDEIKSVTFLLWISNEFDDIFLCWQTPVLCLIILE
jgi:hypothetical protein